MDWKLEVVVVPVTDIERAKSFYVSQLGFRLDADTQPTPAMRVVHMTPPGSACSVVVGPVLVSADADRGPGASLQLVVPDIEAARAQLAGRGIDVSPVQTLDPAMAASSSSSVTPMATTGPCRRSVTGSAVRPGNRR
jgi:catechol 2,3-dioxygenase-like lactoylglutathione lyase family enzyme